MTNPLWPYRLRFALLAAFMLLGAFIGWVAGTRGGESILVEARIILIAVAWTGWIPAVLAWRTSAEGFRQKLPLFLFLAFYLGWEVQLRSTEFVFNPWGSIC